MEEGVHVLLKQYSNVLPDWMQEGCARFFLAPGVGGATWMRAETPKSGGIAATLQSGLPAVGRCTTMRFGVRA
jgi:hypothetical protein